MLNAPRIFEHLRIPIPLAWPVSVRTAVACGWRDFALDATHHPHITMLQQFVRTADLGKVYTAANRILANEKVTSWNLKAFKYYYIPVPPNGALSSSRRRIYSGCNRRY